MKKTNQILMRFVCFALLGLAISSCKHTALQDLVLPSKSQQNTEMAVATTVKYEAETGTIGGGAAVQTASAASGGKVVGALNNIGAYVRVNSVDGGSGGSVKLQVRYANGYTSTRSLSLYVNGANVKQMSFPATGSWNAFATLETTISLNAGTGNTVTLQRNSADVAAADIDYIQIAPGGYEAESGTIGGGSQVQTASAASGGKVVGALNNTGAFVRISSVGGGSGGTVTLQVGYANGYSDTRTLSLYINGVKSKQLSFPATGSWNTFSSIQTTASLNAGNSNTIAIQRDAADVAAADIDYIAVIFGGTTPATWLSGTSTIEVGNGADPAQYFSNWRGTPVQIGQTWPNTPDAWGINPAVSNSWSGFQGPMSLSYDPGPDWVDQSTGQTLTGWRNWATVANGGNDAWWTAAAKKVKALRAGKGTTYVSPFYEFNGDWMAWSVTRTTQGYADFKAGWKRVSDIWRREFPEAKLVLPAAMSRDVPAAMMPDPSTYDLGGGTLYNAWPWEANGATAIQRLEAFRQQVAAAGKPFGITEWANAANPNEAGGGGDAPGFITAMHDWMVQHAGTGAGQLVFETFFNIPGYALDHELIHWNGSAVQVSTTQPQTAARYLDLY
jgi:hypothetical protein